jgi:alpha-tubulin suppressor-like RCC1 family protein
MTTQDDINAFNASCDAACLLVLAAQTNSETTNRQISVATVNDLPDLSLNTITPGTVFFVNSLNIPVIAQVGCWTGLDNRELRSDFNVRIAYSWGRNAAGQLGNLTTTSTSSPVAVTGGIADWCQISGGGAHTLGLRAQGTVWAWGQNSSGELGNSGSSLINVSSPVIVVGGFTDWCQISAGSYHSLGVRTGGSAWAWGSNLQGRLGDGSLSQRASPVSVVGGFTDWCQISGGYAHSLGVRTGGSAWAWGNNGSGRLGDNTITSRLSPVSVVGGFSDWCQVSGRLAHSLGVRIGGSAWAWGYNGFGQLGDNTAISKRSPVSVAGGFGDWSRISNANRADHSIAFRTNGTAWAWGCNGSGRLGDNTFTNRSSPVSVVGGFTDWCQINGGREHNLGLRTNGSAWAWGSNSSGQLGDNTTTLRSSPVSVVSGFSDWCQVSGGVLHSLGIRVF